LGSEERLEDFLVFEDFVENWDRSTVAEAFERDRSVK
jgi:hypothetical protein